MSVRRAAGARAAHPSVLRIASVYPELLGTYGDGGNAAILATRAGWRGQPAEVVSVQAGDPLPRDCDVYLLGGGEDEPQALAAAGISNGQALGAAVDGGAVLFAVCAGLQIIGTSFPGTDGKVHAGAGLVDLVTTPGATRAVGDLVVDPRSELGLDVLYGYENHRGRTSLGVGLDPLGTVRRGIGNGAGQRLVGGTRGLTGGDVEGIWAARGAGLVVGTYLHGPALAQNPQLADRLLDEAAPGLAPMDSSDARAVAADRAAAALRAARAGQTSRG
jgi:CobQ-like glutamine amidotransferase family enzyme